MKKVFDSLKYKIAKAAENDDNDSLANIEELAYKYYVEENLTTAEYLTLCREMDFYS